MDARAALRPRVRAARAPRPQPRRPLRAAAHARRGRDRRRSPPTRCTSARSTTPPSSPPSACSSPATRCCSSAAPPTSRRRAGIRLGALDRGARGVGRGASPPRGEAAARSARRSGCVSLQIEELDLGAPGIAEAVVALQRASYRIEADLLGARTLPALKESPRRLRQTRERFLGAYEGERLVGAVSWKRTGGLVDIHRLVVHPDALPPRHRRRAARRARGAASPTRSAGSSPPARPTRPRAGCTSGTASGRSSEQLVDGVDHDRDLRASRVIGMMPAVSVAALRTRLTPAASVRPAAAAGAAGPCAPVEAARARLPRRSPRCRCCGPSMPTYDPWAWIIWGREVAHLDLDTTDGPVVEAAAGDLHDAVLARGRRRGARRCGC